MENTDNALVFRSAQILVVGQMHTRCQHAVIVAEQVLVFLCSSSHVVLVFGVLQRLVSSQLQVGCLLLESPPEDWSNQPW